ncbi:hypothetical protein DRQ09_09195, partial [candidate division KSB1 bacterium]
QSYFNSVDSKNNYELKKYPDFYTEGIKERNNGNVTRALNIWLEGKDVLEKQGETDPRIGIAFIELVTRYGYKEYYEKASNIYYWGFSKNDVVSKYRRDIIAEIKRLLPLMNKEESKVWKKSYKNGDSLLCSKIKGFWIEKDPTPATKANERLIEHWERIAYARNHFRFNNNSPYGTDDRGLIYVKYGEPDKKKSGVLGANQIEIWKWIDDQGIRQLIDQYSWNPRFEVWVYYNLNSDDPVIYTFGRRNGFGTFGIINGVEDFIPERAFRKTSLINIVSDNRNRLISDIERANQFSGNRINDTSQDFENQDLDRAAQDPVNRIALRNLQNTNVQGILPGAVLQLVYYSQLTNVDEFFERRYLELESIWNQATVIGRFPDHRALRSIRYNYQNIDRNDISKEFAPPDKSIYDEIIPPLKLLCKQTRFLDDRNNPKLAVVVSSYPGELTRGNLKIFFDEVINPEFNLKHTFIIRDKNWNEINRLVDYSTERKSNTSVFVIPHRNENENYMLIAEEFYAKQKEYKKWEFNNILSTNAIAVGKAFIGKNVPLSPDPSKLELSDLVLGINRFPGIDPSFFPFSVIPVDKISKNDTLQIYFEIYHLYYGKDNKTHFTVKFQIEKPQKRGIIKRLLGLSKKKIAVSSNYRFDSTKRNIKEKIAFDISNLTPGKYNFLVEVIDTISLQKKERKGSFEIID